MNTETQAASFTYAIRTMGCKANIYDSLILERELTELGGIPADAGKKISPDVFLLNSCTVTAEADRQCHREVNSIKKKHPNAWTIVTGCYAQVGANALYANSNVELVVGNEAKSTLKQRIAERFQITQAGPGLVAKAAVQSNEDPEIYWGQLPSFRGKTRAFVKIQEGCNDFCTYCIIPYARGKSRSVRPGEIIAEIQRLVEQGIKEVILTGTNIADFGKEFETSLEDLIEGILTHTKLPRLRLSSLDPSEISDRVLALMTPGSRLMPHFHVSLQNTVSQVLRAMKRQYRRETVVDALERIYAKSSNIFIGMDYISGFPSETLEDHNSNMELLSKLPWTRLHVFPYSERAGTPAIRINGVVPIEERKRRAHELMELSTNRHESFVRHFVGQELDGVLFESPLEAGGEMFAVGHSENYLRVLARINESNRGTIGRVRTLGAVPKPVQDWTLESVLL